MFISIIIPIKNEPAIQALLFEIEATINQNHEIIVVDKSKEKLEVRGVQVIVQKSDGLGNAFVEGLSCAKGDVIALMDGDGSHRPEDLLHMLSYINQNDIVLGSKLIKGAKSCDTLGRRIVTLAFAWMTRLVLWIDIKDPMTGFMVARRNIFDNLRLNPRGFKIVIEIVYKSRGSVMEVPISFRERQAGSSKAGFNMNGIKEMFRILGLLFELKLGRIRGFW
jgi:dolichol-phosphate mannosyltransferase